MLDLPFGLSKNFAEEEKEPAHQLVNDFDDDNSHDE